MTGLRRDPVNGPIGDSLFVLVEVGGKIAPSIIARWIYDRVSEYDAKGVKINGREPVGAGDFERSITEEIVIGKND